MSTAEELEQQLEDINEEIASGVSRERYDDKEVWTRPLSDLYRIRADLERRLGISQKSTRFAAHDRGVRS